MTLTAFVSEKHYETLSLTFGVAVDTNTNDSGFPIDREPVQPDSTFLQ